MLPSIPKGAYFLCILGVALPAVLVYLDHLWNLEPKKFTKRKNHFLQVKSPNFRMSLPHLYQVLAPPDVSWFENLSKNPKLLRLCSPIWQFRTVALPCTNVINEPRLSMLIILNPSRMSGFLPVMADFRLGQPHSTGYPRTSEGNISMTLW